MADSDAPIEVEVVYAQAQHAVERRIALAAGSTVGDALLLAAADAAFAGVELSHATLGIYGVVVGREQILNDGDRIEIYRPLAQDPKSARRNRARAGRRR